jgi:RNA-binding protein 39
MSILPALALNGQLLAGHPVLVKPSESEKNAAAQLAKVQAAMSAAPNPLESQLRISNVHKNVRERDLEDIFSPFGKIEQLEIQEDAAGGDLGMAAVQFTNVDAARKAMQALNGLELAGATIVVTTAAPYSGASAVAAAATGAYQQTVDVGEIDDDGKTGLALNASARVRLEACL